MERAPGNGVPGERPVTNPTSRPVTTARSPVWIRKTGGADKPHLETHVELSHPPTTATLIMQTITYRSAAILKQFETGPVVEAKSSGKWTSDLDLAALLGDRFPAFVKEGGVVVVTYTTIPIEEPKRERFFGTPQILGSFAVPMVQDGVWDSRETEKGREDAAASLKSYRRTRG